MFTIMIKESAESLIDVLTEMFIKQMTEIENPFHKPTRHGTPTKYREYRDQIFRYYHEQFRLLFSGVRDGQVSDNAIKAWEAMGLGLYPE